MKTNVKIINCYKHRANGKVCVELALATYHHISKKFFLAKYSVYENIPQRYLSDWISKITRKRTIPSCTLLIKKHKRKYN